MPQPCFVFIVLLQLFACFAPPPLAQTAPWKPKPKPTPRPSPSKKIIHHIYFNIASQSYVDLYGALSNRLRKSTHDGYKPSFVAQRPVLGPRRLDFYDEPPGWIHIHVVGESPEDKVTLAIAIDDLYLLGFSNGTDHWYKFDRFKGLPDGARVLPIRHSYGDLITGGHENLWQVPLGKQSALHATKELARYDHAITPTSQLKDGLVRFVVMISEAMRFRVIRDAFWRNNWDKETSISASEAKYVWYWSKISTLLVLWEDCKRETWTPKGKYHKLEKIVGDGCGIKDPEMALKIVDFLLRPIDI